MLFVSTYLNPLFNVIQFSSIVIYILCFSYPHICVFCLGGMIIEERAEMPICNLAKTIHNKWPTIRQQDNLFIWSYSGQYDSYLHANCKLLDMVERGGLMIKVLIWHLSLQEKTIPFQQSFNRILLIRTSQFGTILTQISWLRHWWNVQVILIKTI